MNEALTWLLDVVQGVDPVVRTVLAGVAIMLETSIFVGLIMPGDTVVIVASTAVGSPLEGVVLAIAVLVGALMGESIGYWLGRVLGSRIRYSRPGRRIGERNWERAETYLRRRGGPAIFLSRFLPVLHSIVPFTVGMSGMAYRRFLAWTTPACAIWAALYVSVGALTAGTYRELSDQLHYAGYLFVGAIAVFIVAVFVAKKIVQKREQRHLEPETPAAAASDVED